MHTMSKPSFAVQAKFKFYTDEESLAGEWKHAAKCNASQITFLEGILLKTLDHNSPFLYVDYSVFYGGIRTSDSVTFQELNTTLPVNNVLRVQNHQYSTDIPPRRVSEPGCYDELECIARNDVSQLPRTPVSKDSVYILSSFRATEQTQNLEKIWKVWSGANYILWKCPKQLNIRRITFLRTTTSTDPFSYLVLCECEEGLNFLNHAKEFSDRLRQRWCGLVGLYKVERYYIPPKERRTI
ncbi:uncharacterized protein LOC132552720 [Ylistrum balloti]|uniref:uncharacterized protein LOC132552720 n=1 Tax=Ylistrum balloti TaxID=509963 RepID=UPI0029059DCC|nr:uncharacterized protein LOC132552720 [Ylistrum balloti]